MNGEQQPKRSIDERLDALAQSVELLAQMHVDNEKRMAESFKRIDTLWATVESHEREWQRFRRAMRAALAEWFSDNGDDGEQS